jgi:hypothetical protein
MSQLRLSKKRGQQGLWSEIVDLSDNTTSLVS